MPFEITEELVHFLMDQNKKQSEQIFELTAQVEALTQKIAELTEKNNKNSNNSSKPPSSDGLKRTLQRREASVKKQVKSKEVSQVIKATDLKLKVNQIKADLLLHQMQVMP